MTAAAYPVPRVSSGVPTAGSTAPGWAITSGTRNPPPISTSSPRDTRTSRPAASAASMIIVAAALLFTTTAASAPVSRQSSAWACTSRRPRSPRARSYSSVAYPRAIPLTKLLDGRNASEISHTCECVKAGWQNCNSKDFPSCPACRPAILQYYVIDCRGPHQHRQGSDPARSRAEVTRSRVQHVFLRAPSASALGDALARRRTRQTVRPLLHREHRRPVPVHHAPAPLRDVHRSLGQGAPCARGRTIRSADAPSFERARSEEAA